MEDNFYRRYVGSYLITYIGLSFLLTALAYLPFLDSLPGSFNIVIALVSAILPAYLFVKDHGRAPDALEKRRFAAVNLVIVSLLSIAVLACLWNFVMLPEEREALTMELMHTPFWVFAVVTILFFGLYYLGIGWAFGWAAKLQLKAIDKQKEKGRG